MKATFVVVALLAILAGAQAQKVAAVSKDWDRCIFDLQSIFHLVAKTVLDVSEGQYMKLIDDLVNIYEAAVDAKNHCFSSFPTSANGIKCMKVLSESKPAFRNVIDQLKAKKIFSASKDAIKLVYKARTELNACRQFAVELKQKVQSIKA